ncbi:MAG: hypothetical protein AAF772_17120 [Acidobacteriota bacterium]
MHHSHPAVRIRLACTALGLALWAFAAARAAAQTGSEHPVAERRAVENGLHVQAAARGLAVCFEGPSAADLPCTGGEALRVTWRIALGKVDDQGLAEARLELATGGSAPRSINLQIDVAIFGGEPIDAAQSALFAPGRSKLAPGPPSALYHALVEHADVRHWFAGLPASGGVAIAYGGTAGETSIPATNVAAVTNSAPATNTSTAAASSAADAPVETTTTTETSSTADAIAALTDAPSTADAIVAAADAVTTLPPGVMPPPVAVAAQVVKAVPPETIAATVDLLAGQPTTAEAPAASPTTTEPPRPAGFDVTFPVRVAHPDSGFRHGVDGRLRLSSRGGVQFTPRDGTADGGWQIRWSELAEAAAADGLWDVDGRPLTLHTRDGRRIHLVERRRSGGFGDSGAVLRYLTRGRTR